MSSSEKPSVLPQDRHTEFSNASCCPQLGQMKSRTKHSPLEGRHVDGHVDHAALRVGVDDAAQRRHVGVVAAEADDDVALVDHLVVGRDRDRATDSAASTPTPTRGWRRCRPCVPFPAAGRSPDSPRRSWPQDHWRAGRRSPAARSPGIPLRRPPKPRDLGGHRRRARPVGEVVVDPRVQVAQHVDQRPARRETRCGVRRGRRR